MSSTNKTTHYELSQYIGTDKPTYLSDYNDDMLKIDTGIHDAASDASTALTTANSAASTAADASAAASTATTTANSANTTALEAKTTAETASTNAATALAAVADAEEAAAANTIENLAPAYDPTLTYDVDDLVTYVDAQGSGKLYKCIIAVTSPEAFNINKWDDVTTSEVYGNKYSLLATVTSDGVKTYEQLLRSIIDTQVLYDLQEKNYDIVLKHFAYSIDTVRTYTLQACGPSYANFIGGSSSAVNSGNLTFWSRSVTVSSDQCFIGSVRSDYSTNSVAISELSILDSQVPGNNASTFSIYVRKND